MAVVFAVISVLSSDIKVTDMETKGIRAVSYQRVSSREQLEGHSLDAQAHNIQEYIRLQGWEMVRMYTDAGISAKKDSQRPELERLLEDTRGGQFDVVVVDKIDRFYRHLGGLLITLDQLNAMGVGFASVQEKLDFTTHWGKLTLTVLGMLAEIYLDVLKQETTKGKRQRAREGLWNGSIPFGYCKGLCSRCTDPNGKDYCPNFGTADKSDGKTLIAHPIESAGVKLAYIWYQTGENSDAKIARLLNAHYDVLPDGKLLKLRHKGTLGKTSPGMFSKDTVRVMLTNVFYTGKVPYYGVDDQGRRQKRQSGLAAIYPGKHPALVDETIFEKAQELRKLLHKSPKKMHKRPVMIYPLTGLLHCSSCGSRLRGVSSHDGRRYYRDVTRIEKTGKCAQPLIRAGSIEQQIVQILLQATQDAPDLVRSAQVQIDAADKRYERAKFLYLAGDISREAYEEERERRESTLGGLRDVTDGAIMIPVDEVYQSLVHWDSILPIERKKLLRAVLEAAFVRQNALVALQPTVTFLLMFGEKRCSCGPDGDGVISK
jgi:DNA invertase Pin-like site-specific DNA recombinase